MTATVDKRYLRLPGRIRGMVEAPSARKINLAAGTLWCAAFGVFCATAGLPTKRLPVVAWVVLAVLALEAGRMRRALRGLAFAWLPVIGALACYDVLRGMSDDLVLAASLGPHLWFDEIVFGTVPSVWLQQHFYVPGSPQWYDYLAWGTYTSHFIFPLALGVTLWKLASPRFAPYMAGLLGLSFLALVTYTLYPAIPPWMAARDGHIDGHIARVVHAMWDDVGVHKAATVWSTTPGVESRYSNPVAALPSLHAAFPVLILLAMRGLHRLLTAALVVYPLLMGAALVYGGEHYVFDVLVGWGYAVGVWWLVSHLLPRMEFWRRVAGDRLTRGLSVR